MTTMQSMVLVFKGPGAENTDVKDISNELGMLFIPAIVVDGLSADEVFLPDDMQVGGIIIVGGRGLDIASVKEMHRTIPIVVLGEIAFDGPVTDIVFASEPFRAAQLIADEMKACEQVDAQLEQFAEGDELLELGPGDLIPLDARATA